MEQEKIWHHHPLRVRYEETDQMGVVYHANYLTWFEIGRTELIRELGYPYRKIEEKGLLLPVIEAEAKFKKPARYDDLIGIYTRVGEASSIRIDFQYEIRLLPEGLQSQPLPSQPLPSQPLPSQQLQTQAAVKPQGELLVTGTTRHVWVNPSWKPVRIEKEAPDLWHLLTKYI
ncbi:acyl-CoA thioesterase [Paenibacillus aestuarii]|uniref:Acyl-CoA thioesterase n=1 Tax=Paenibacillus aestuarii TaxID=516965 RepID=A0ABW0KH74_9BACL|nr:thioesterase family protein [Paenibacillus aestuarii]